MDRTKFGGEGSHGSGNVKDDPERAAEAGRKGGQSSGGKSAGNDSGRKSESIGRQ